MSAGVVDTTDVAKVRVLGSVVPGVTVSTVDCVLNDKIRAADGNETDFYEEASNVTAAVSAASLGSAIVLETAVGAEILTVADGVIVTYTAGCAKRFEAGCAVFERLESDDACVPVNGTNERGAPLENGSPKTTEAEPGVAEYLEEMVMRSAIGRQSNRLLNIATN